MLDLRDLAVPVVGAPMAGGPTTPALVEAVSGAGGLGCLAAGYRSAEAVAADAARVGSAYGLNLFHVPRYDAEPAALASYRDSLRAEADRLGVELGEPTWDDDGWAAKLALVCDLRPALVSFTFGCPDAEVLLRLTGLGVLTCVTVTTVEEAVEAAERGAGSLAVQGDDAGGHRGTWDPEATPDTTPLVDLVRAVTAAVEVPVVAGGGLADAAGVRAVLDAGAVAAQVGTAYLLADEAGTNPTHRAALADPTMGATALTRAWTGRWARGLANRFMAEHADAPAGYPQLHHVTAPLRAAAIAAGDTEVAHLWAGTGHASARTAPAAEITRSLLG